MKFIGNEKRPAAGKPKLEIEELAGLKAKVHPVHGGGTVHVYSIDSNLLIIHLRERNVRFECSLGELEALSQLYDRIMEKRR